MDADLTRSVLAALERHGVSYAVFGGVAMNLHGLPRATEDLDVFLAPTAENVERLRRALRDVFEDPSIDEITAGDLLGDYPAVQYVPPEGSFHLDLLTRLGDAFRFADLETERIDFDGLLVSVVTPRTLHRMKKDTVLAPELPDRGLKMPVRKFRSVEEMDEPRQYEPGSPELFAAISRVWALADRMAPLRFPPGVYKHRTIEDADRLREQWEAANVERVRRERARP